VTRVALFVTCVGDLVAPEVPAATVRVLRACGADVEVPEGQTCCGQPAWNAGFAPEAAAVAGASLDALAAALDGPRPPDDVVVPAGSCATMMRLYWPTLFETVGDHDAAARARRIGERIRELGEWLDDHGDDLPPLAATPAHATVAHHQSCHLVRELGAGDQAGAVLDRVEGCEVAAWPEADRCCGFGGTFSVKLPEVSAAMADEKLDSLPDGVVRIVGSDASCLLQLRTRARHRGLPVVTAHLAEVVADALPADAPGEARR
jgi:L-lactate dehydrogenase complex protein LldE